MQNMIHIALNDLRIFFSQRGNLIGLTVLPIFMTIALGIAFGGSIGNGDSTATVQYRVDVIDKDQTDTSAQFIEGLRESGILLLCPMDDSSEQSCELDDKPLDIDLSIQRIEDDIVTATLLIPQGFEADLQIFQPVSITYYTDENLQSGSPVGTAVSAVLEEFNGALNAGRIGAYVGGNLGDGFADDAEEQQFTQDVYDRATTLLENEPLIIRYILTEEGEQSGTEVGTGFGQSVPGIGAMQVLFTVLAGIVTLIRERKQWTIQRLAVMPISRAEILGGKILSYFILGMIQYAILLAVGFLVGVDYGASILAILILVSAFVLCVTALTFAIATRVTSEDQANGMSTLLSLLLAPLGGAWWPLAIVPDFMQVIGHISPVAWVMDGFNDLIFFGGSLADILPEVGVLLIASAVLFVFGVRGFTFGD